MRQYFRQYFIFSENERRAVICLTLLAAALFVLPYIVKRFHKENIAIDNSLQGKVSAFSQEYMRATADKNTEKQTLPLFVFDPNKIGVEEWRKLGLSEKQATVIENYKAKGGTFYKAEDIRKIFVLSDEKKEALLPYIRIENTGNKRENTSGKEVASVIQQSKYQREKIDINTADSAQFEKLPFIGAKRASGIVKYRGWLGGFHSIEQLSEVYALPDSVYQKIKPRLTMSEIELRKLNINTADYNTFRGHPYTRRIAGYIIKYRDANGDFKTADQICRVPEMVDSICRKLLPYIVTE